MSVPKITAQQFEQQIQTGITTRDDTTDVSYGPVKDIVVTPVAQVLEPQNDRLRQVSQLISLENVSQFSNADLDATVFNEGLVRSDGTQATTSLTFARATVPATDATVQRGFPIATSPDESTGQSVTFVTTESRTLPVATASSYFNLATQRYELSVPAIALISGAVGKVGPNRINRPLRPLVNFDTVTNTDSVSDGGLAPEDNTELAQRYQISVLGRQLSTPTGITKYVKDQFPAVEDVNPVYGNNPLLTRSSTDAGAVDAFVIAPQVIQTSEDLTFFGIGQLMEVSFPPLVSVVSVQFGINVLVEGVDYEVTFDSSGVSGSTRAADGITILPTTTQVLVSGSSLLTTVYTYNTLVRDLQVNSLDPDVFVFGEDLLYRLGTQLDLVLNANVTVFSGFNPTTVLSFVSTAISNLINNLGLGDPIEQFDIEEAAGSVSGVDNFVITRLTTSTTPSGVSDIFPTGREYGRISDANLVLTNV